MRGTPLPSLFKCDPRLRPTPPICRFFRAFAHNCFADRNAFGVATKGTPGFLLPNRGLER